MVFHSHQKVVDNSGNVHNLCYYKDCNLNSMNNKEESKESDNIVKITQRKFLKKNSKDSSLLNQDKKSFINSDTDDDEDDRKIYRRKSKKKYSPRKGPIFKLKLSSDIVSEDFRKRHKERKAAAASNIITSDYSSDEYIEIDSDTESMDNDHIIKSPTSCVGKASEINSPTNIDDEGEEYVDVDGTEVLLSSNCKEHDFKPKIIDKISQQSSNLESFHKSIEDIRNVMISSINKFCFEQQSTSRQSSSLENPLSQKNRLDTNKEFLEDFDDVPFKRSKPNIIVDADKNKKSKNKIVRIPSRSGTSESPIILDNNNDLVIPQVKPYVLIDNIDKNESKSPESIVKPKSQLINWFSRDEFKEFMLKSAKRRLEELEDDNRNFKKYIRIERSSDFLNNWNDSIESSPIQIPSFKNEKYLNLALTLHSGRREYVDDEGLEIFGDYILSTTISQMSYEKFKDQLTPDLLERIHKYLCSDFRLCQFAKMLKLQDLIYASKPFLSVKEMADVFIELLAAIIMDSGREIAVDFIRKIIGPTIDELVRKGKFIGEHAYDSDEEIQIKNVVDD